MTTETDWFMRQVKGVANMIGSALRLRIQHLDLGTVEDEEGRRIKGTDYLLQLLEEERFEEAIDFVQAQIKRLPLNQYEWLAEQFLLYLRSLAPAIRDRHGLDQAYLEELEQELKEFRW